MSTTAPFSTFVRPPGSPIYSPNGPSLTLPRRTPSGRASRQVAAPREDPVVEARRQIARMLTLLQTVDDLEAPKPAADPQAEEQARALQQLETRLTERERVVIEREARLAERERDLAEAEVLLQHHEALVAAARRLPISRTAVSEEERTALLNLKKEVDRQDALLRESREAMRERERFIEASEARLFEKVQRQQEKETELEQREEELASKLRAVSDGEHPKQEFDEFNE